MLARKALAGTAGAPKLYVEDVFSTYLYTGNGTSQTITNGVDLAGKGGLVWSKRRNVSLSNLLFDTVRGNTKYLVSNTNGAEGTDSPATYLTSFNNNGFSVGAAAATNNLNDTYASWTFRKAEKFFDVVTYTGNGTDNRAINHNLNSTPGYIVIKRTDSADSWWCYHRSMTSTNYYMSLNGTGAQTNLGQQWIATSSTTFSVWDSGLSCNANGATYVAYLFAHNAGGFGDAGSDNVISCGSFTGSINGFVDLGFEPQWVLVKKSSGVEDWQLFDNMRGMTMGDDSMLNPNTSGAENNSSGNNYLNPQPTGFTQIGFGSGTFIYIAIRRGPMKTPETGTSVFAVNLAPDTSTAPLTWNTNSTVDSVLTKRNLSNTNGNNIFVDRLRGNSATLTTNSSGDESTNANITDLTISNGYIQKLVSTGGSGSAVTYAFSRAPGFFDVVCYTGTGANRTVTHNLGVAPELMIIKSRSFAYDWAVYAAGVGNTSYGVLNDPGQFIVDSSGWNNTSPTSSVFTVGTGTLVNGSGDTYVAYLFASCPGVSKVGSYTGNGSSVTVTTDFQPRFILVKRTDSTGNWIVSDSARGLVAGNDPYLLLNSTAAEDTDEDWVDITSTSFTVNQTTAANANVNTGTYIYLAIA